MIFLRHEVTFAVRWALNIDQLLCDATLQVQAALTLQAGRPASCLAQTPSTSLRKLSANEQFLLVLKQ